ncbi:cysteine and histidine-rich domain-containing protein 1-like [Mercenaria mercenaria]|uniref:cysteine and histidine-rich domain-containing protein 1-like n=1 Tax=Mercenaria mercenaria TaxID=6596 RepID=UPI00234E3C7B|nr:cysteine and histidine-rich domain-containing protein 1-like [Mercenaria mercenaria]
MELLQCYNKGCGSKYDPTKNESDSCHYHPGVPVFHDALKGWSCCKKRSTDFTEFLNFPGCTSGQHSNEKPKEPETPKPVVDVPDTAIQKEEKPKPEMMKQKFVESVRPSEDEPLQKLKVTVTPSLQKALDKCLQEMSIQSDKDKDISNGTDDIKVGTTCKNSSCKATYQSEESNKETCQYHPGVAIFHEGMKFWSCCQRKTSDFTNFLDQVGCQTGTHLWIKKETEDTKKNCRLDWFQTGPNVNISVFAKVAVPDKTVIEVNQVVCKIHIVFEGGKSVYEHELILRNPIIPEKSEVKLLGTKVEIVLRKLESFSWPCLEMPQSPPAKPEEKDSDSDDIASD